MSAGPDTDGPFPKRPLGNPLTPEELDRYVDEINRLASTPWTEADRVELGDRVCDALDYEPPALPEPGDE